MRRFTLTAVLVLGFLLAGCDKRPDAPDAPAASSPAGTPVTQPAITAWQQKDQARAVKRFVETDWSNRPLFPSNSPLSLSEEQFRALSSAERQSQSAEMLSQLDTLKKVAAAVTRAGRDAASKGDAAQAKKYFTAVKESGNALDQPENLRLLQLVGQGWKKAADAELKKQSN